MVKKYSSVRLAGSIVLLMACCARIFGAASEENRATEATFAATNAIAREVNSKFNGLAPGGGASEPKRVASEAIENLFILGNGLLSGGEPAGEAAFAQLEKLGVKTILSVDGSKPDLEAAHRHGIAYAHLPLGYDGYESNACLRLSKAAGTLPKPLFVHCHHGRHRGPAAAAIMALSIAGWTQEQAENWLRMAGTSTNYPGLFETVRLFRKPESNVLDQVSREFPETASTLGIVEAMVEIDRAWDHLKILERTGFRPSSEHPDLVPALEASRITGRFIDVSRLEEASKYGAGFAEALSNASKHARELAEQLAAMKPGQEPGAGVVRSQKQLGQSCVDCHRAFRDKVQSTRQHATP